LWTVCNGPANVGHGSRIYRVMYGLRSSLAMMRRDGMAALGGALSSASACARTLAII